MYTCDACACKLFVWYLYGCECDHALTSIVDHRTCESLTMFHASVDQVNVNSPVLTLTAVGERVWAGLGCGAIIAFETAVRVIEDGTRVHDVKVLHRYVLLCFCFCCCC